VKVFLASTSLAAAYGGPAYSVGRLAQALADCAVEVGLWAPDQSAPFLAERTAVKRLGGSVVEALGNFGATDIIHDNGLWLPHHHRFARFATQRRIARVVSTRGMLEPWAIRHKRLKKSIAWALFQRRDLQRAQCLHATSAQELRNLEKLDLGVPVCVVPNGVDVADIRPKDNEGGLRTALFLGRLYPVKGLPILIEAWARVRPKDWRLQIAGPDEAGHRAELARAISAAGLRDVISFLGPVADEAKRAAFAHADLLVLPSHSESFGLVVAEALAHGVPVLTTTAAPWPELAQRGCGWSVAPTPDGIADGLRQATAAPSSALRAMGEKGRAWMAAEFGWSAIAQRFLAAYERLLASG
jgi:glycosyltransferase involved in cell wall biosynthesis